VTILRLFEKRKLKKNEDNINSLAISYRNFYLYEQFKQRLSIERRRAEKVNQQLSLLIFNLRYHQLSNAYLFFGVDVNSLLTIVLSNVRETDVVSFYEFRQIFVLLPDTSITEAAFVRQSLIRKISTLPNFVSSSDQRITDDLVIIEARTLILEEIIPSATPSRPQRSAKLGEQIKSYATK